MATSVDLGSVYAKLLLDTKDFENGVQKASNSLGGMESMLRATASLLRNSMVAGVTAATGALISLGVKGVASANQLQTLQLQMNGLTKSMNLGAKAMAGAYEYAQKAPFQLPEVAGATKTMLAFGMNVEQAVSSLELLGNVSITSGVPLEAIAGIFGRVSAQGRLMGGDIQQLTENGISVLPALQKQLGKTAEEVRELASKGKIDFATFSKAMESIVDPSILEQLNNTLPRQIDRLKGSVRQLSNAFVGVSVDAVQGYKQAADGITQAVTDLTKNLADQLRSPNMKKAFANIGKSLVPVIRQISDLIKPVMNLIASIAQAIAPALVGIGQMVVNLFTSMMPGVKAFFDALGRAMQVLQPVLAELGTALGESLSILLTAIAPLLVPIAEALSAILYTAIELMPVIVGVVNAFITFKVITGIMTLVTTAVSIYNAVVMGMSASTTAAATAMTLLNAVMALNPAVLVTVAIVGMITAFGLAVASSNNLKGTTEGLKDAKDRLADSTIRVKDAERELDDARIARKYSDIAVEEATMRLTELKNQGKEGTTEYRRAELDLEVAKLRAKEASDKEKEAIRLEKEEKAKNKELTQQLAEKEAFYAKTKGDSLKVIEEVSKKEATAIDNVSKQIGTQRGKLDDLSISLGAISNKDYKYSITGVYKTIGVPVKAPGNAKGTDYWRGGLTWVGEEGPELVSLPRGTKITPNDKLNSVFRNNINTTSAATENPISIYGDINIANKSDADYLLQRLSRRQELTIDGIVGI